MKLACYLAVLLVMLLSVKPCCTDNDCAANNRQVSQPIKKATKPGNDCQGCSAFFACGQCAASVIAQTVLYNLPLIPVKHLKHTYIYCQPYVEDVGRPIWQPPQIN